MNLNQLIKKILNKANLPDCFYDVINNIFASIDSTLTINSPLKEKIYLIGIIDYITCKITYTLFSDLPYVNKLKVDEKRLYSYISQVDTHFQNYRGDVVMEANP